MISEGLHFTTFSAQVHFIVKALAPIELSGNVKQPIVYLRNIKSKYYTIQKLLETVPESNGVSPAAIEVNE